MAFFVQLPQSPWKIALVAFVGLAIALVGISTWLPSYVRARFEAATTALGIEAHFRDVSLGLTSLRFSEVTAIVKDAPSIAFSAHSIDVALDFNQPREITIVDGE